MKRTLERTMKAFAVLSLALAGAFVAVAAPVLAPELMTAPVEGDGRAPHSKVTVLNGISFLNGGANIDDAQYLKSRGAEFPLQFVFSGRGGEYGVADKLSIRSGEREVLTVPDAGPYLMLKLPAGRYNVEATFKGVVEKRTVVVGSGATLVSWNTLRASD
jgi:hypothetical protein